MKLLRERIAGVEIRDLTVPIGAMRSIKSPTEIELLRRAGELTGIGVREAMRSTRPGVMEYQLDAVMRYHFLAGGARDRAYIAICASGVNIPNAHYCANRHVLDDWVLVDCAPDFHYYCSDIGRMWPIGGTYSKAQRSIYGYVVEYHKVLLEEVRAGRTAEEVRDATDERMRPVLESWKFHDPIHEQAARTLHGQVSHGVGMCVHDRAHHYAGPIQAGQVISLDPTVSVRGDTPFYCRIEDTVVITEDGCENLTGGAPINLDDVEALMLEDGLLQAFPEAFQGMKQ
jgi:Xaa-Pro aminopeptidase